MSYRDSDRYRNRYDRSPADDWEGRNYSSRYSERNKRTPRYYESDRNRSFRRDYEEEPNSNYGFSATNRANYYGRGYEYDRPKLYRDDRADYFDDAQGYRNSSRPRFNRDLSHYRRRDTQRVGDYEMRRNFEGPEGERGWWDRLSDEVASWFGDEEAEMRRRRDEMSAGSHRGKGPRGYKRSDERIREDVSDRLKDYDYLDASDIEVKVNQAVVLLEGTVDSRWAKRIAEEIVEIVSGVEDVQNNLRVGRGMPTRESATVDAGDQLHKSLDNRARAKGA